METVFYPKRENWNEIIKRPHLDVTELNATVSGILSHVRNQGDEAVLQYEEQFDHVSLTSLSVSEEEICEALRTVDPELMESLEIAHHNIAAFHQAQRYEGISVETAPGVTCSQRSVPIEKVGLYIPGGTAPLFSTISVPSKTTSEGATSFPEASGAVSMWAIRPIGGRSHPSVSGRQAYT